MARRLQWGVLAASVLAATAAGGYGLTRLFAHTEADRPGHRPRFDSIPEAVAFLQSKIDVPVVLPPSLPPATQLAQSDPVHLAVFGHRVNGQLHLTFGSHGILDLQFGLSMFDGCGADAARSTTVRGRPALVYTSPQSSWTEVIWPATPRHPEGVYGLAGTFSMKRALALAQSMELARVRARHATMGC